jgi:hypothetical protein
MVFKGAAGLIVIVAIIWIFWMTKVWLTKNKK